MKKRIVAFIMSVITIFSLLPDPVTACAEELMYVYNNLEHTNYSSMDRPKWHRGKGTAVHQWDLLSVHCHERWMDRHF